MDFDPRAERRRTRDGEGPRWNLLREEALERDDYTCQRCGYRRPEDGTPDLERDDRPCGGDDPSDENPSDDDPERRLEVHNAASHRRPSLDRLELLVTVCRPCHATLHPEDPAYGDLAERAPLFPRPDAPPAVATMRTDRQHVCQRCQRLVDSPTDLAAYVPDGGTYVLCRPCAGALLAADYDPEDFEVAGELDGAALRARSEEAPVRPAMLAAGPVRALRPPATRLERVLYDTPLRYLVNPLGMTLLFLIVGVALSFWLF